MTRQHEPNLSEQEQLALYQRRLLEILYQTKNATEARARLDALSRELSESEIAREYLQFDTRMLDAALALTKQWAVPKHKPT